MLTQARIPSIFEDESDIPFDDLIGSLFKVEMDLKKKLVESKAITNARWSKAIKDLDEVRGIEWPTKREIYVWEAVGLIKALPTERS